MVENNIDPIAQSLVQSLTAYFGLPFVYPGPARPGTAQTASGGPVNLRSTPAVTGPGHRKNSGRCRRDGARRV